MEGPAPTTELRELCGGLRFPEGPIARPDGGVLVVEIEGGALTRIGPDGVADVVVETGGGPNGAAVGPGGQVFICNNGGFTWHERDGLRFPIGPASDYAGGSIQQADPTSGTVRTLYAEVDGRPLNSPNDIVFDDVGGFYFTDMGHTRRRDADRGAVLYAAADGSGIREVITPLDQPNGVGLSPDGSELYVSETVTGRIWAWEVKEPGRVVRRRDSPHPTGARLVHALAGYQLADSMAVDDDGNLFVAVLVSGTVQVIDPSGELLAVHPVPGDDPYVTNVCFGGGDGRTMFVTSSGRGRVYTSPYGR